MILEFDGPWSLPSSTAFTCKLPWSSSWHLSEISLTTSFPFQDAVLMFTLNSLLTVSTREDLTHTRNELCCYLNRKRKPKWGNVMYWLIISWHDPPLIQFTSIALSFLFKEWKSVPNLEELKRFHSPLTSVCSWESVRKRPHMYSPQHSRVHLRYIRHGPTRIFYKRAGSVTEAEVIHY